MHRNEIIYCSNKSNTHSNEKILCINEIKSFSDEIVLNILITKLLRINLTVE